jgi:hypothetical protein
VETRIARIDTKRRRKWDDGKGSQAVHTRLLDKWDLMRRIFNHRERIELREDDGGMNLTEGNEGNEGNEGKSGDTNGTN